MCNGYLLALLGPKKALNGRNSEGFLLSRPRTANLFDNVDIRALITFSKSGALKLSCVWLFSGENLLGLLANCQRGI